MKEPLDRIIQAFDWLRIAVSPALTGLLSGGLVYSKIPGPTGMTLWVLIALAGVVFGVYWAERIRKRRGTSFFMNGLFRSENSESGRKNESSEQGPA
jgi:hypothetical protein